jgi:hypothetical protein
MELALGILGIVAVIIPFGIKWYLGRKVKRDALARTEADELIAGMDAVDKRVLPPPE